MGRSSTQITLEDRCEMAHFHATGHSLHQSAAALDRAPSTVARDLTRNASPPQGSPPGSADQQARARRWQGPKLTRDRPPSPHSSRPCPPPGAQRAPSRTGRSVRATTPSLPSASSPSSVRPTRPGQRAASSTPSAACAGPCRASPTWHPSRRSTVRASSRCTLLRLGTASALRHPPRLLPTLCCTSNVNPPYDVDGNDGWR